MSDNIITEATTIGDASPATTSATVRPVPPPKRPRRMRYADRVRGIDVDAEDQQADPTAPKLEDGADDELGLPPSAYVTAAQQMAQDAPQGQEGAPEETGGQPEWADAFTPKADAAGDQGADLTGRDERHRAQLREAEAERDRLAGLVDVMRQAEVRRLASGRLADPGDLFRDEASVADMLASDGQVDPARVDAAVANLLEAHPHWAAPGVRYRGPLRSGSTSVQFERPSFADAFKPEDAFRRE